MDKMYSKEMGRDSGKAKNQSGMKQMGEIGNAQPVKHLKTVDMYSGKMAPKPNRGYDSKAMEYKY